MRAAAPGTDVREMETTRVRSVIDAQRTDERLPACLVPSRAPLWGIGCFVPSRAPLWGIGCAPQGVPACALQGVRVRPARILVHGRGEGGGPGGYRLPACFVPFGCARQGVPPKGVRPSGCSQRSASSSASRGNQGRRDNAVHAQRHMSAYPRFGRARAAKLTSDSNYVPACALQGVCVPACACPSGCARQGLPPRVRKAPATISRLLTALPRRSLSASISAEMSLASDCRVRPLSHEGPVGPSTACLPALPTGGSSQREGAPPVPVRGKGCEVPRRGMPYVPRRGIRVRPSGCPLARGVAPDDGASSLFRRPSAGACEQRPPHARRASVTVLHAQPAVRPLGVPFRVRASIGREDRPSARALRARADNPASTGTRLSRARASTPAIEPFRLLPTCKRATARAVPRLHPFMGWRAAPRPVGGTATCVCPTGAHATPTPQLNQQRA